MKKSPFLFPAALSLAIVSGVWGQAALAACDAACSPYCGQATLNEYFYGAGSDSTFIEAVVPKSTGIPATTYGNWTVKVMGGVSATLGSGSSCTFGSRTFLAATFAANALPKPTGSSDVTVLLLDQNNKIIDMLVAGSKANPTANTTGYAACSSVNDTASATANPSYLAHTIVTGDAAAKGYARSPDFSLSNTGKWYPETGTGAGTNSTKCAPNAGFAISKSITSPLSAQPLPGDTVRYLVGLTNQSSTTAGSNVDVTDTLDAGLSYVAGSAVPSAGSTFNYPTWRITSLPAGNGTASLQFDASVSCSVLPGAVKNNTVSVETKDLYGNDINATDDALATVQAFDHLNLAYSGTPGCGDVPVVVTACRDASCSQTYTQCPVSVTLGPASAWSPTAVVVSGSANATIPALTLNTPYTLTAAPNAYATVGATTCNGSAASCTFTTPATCPTASAFDAYETSISDANAATPANRILKTRLAGGASLCTAGGACTLTVAAFDSGNAVATAYSGSLTASLEYCTAVTRGGGGMTCGAWAAVPGVAAQTATISSGGKTTVTFPAVGNAYEMVRVKLVSASVTGGPWTSYDKFAIRPQRLVVTASDDTWTTAGTTRVLDTSNTHKAGRPFTLAATGEGSVGSATAGYAATTGSGPVLSSLTVTNPASGGVAGTLALGTWAAISNGLGSTTASYTEVGSVSATLEDRSFADVDLGDSSTAERYFSGTATIGRFVPDHFKTEVTPACGASFTYSAQPFTLKVTAQSAVANSTTENYAGTLARVLALSDAGSSAVGAFSPATVASGQFAAGVATVNNQTYAFAASATVPTTITVRATEPAGADGVSSADTGGSEGASALRSGRLWLANAYGSELVALPVPMQTQYWTSTGWTLNTLDNCTALTVPTQANAGLTNTLSGKTTATLSSPVVGGQAGFRLSAPGAGNTGVVDIAGSVVRGASSWLQLSAPTARACFGVCGPRSPVIYQRERY